MRYALIDNATLTAVQRVLGEIPVRNKLCLDNDLLCFENYIQAILFFDEIICIDDYKPEYRDRRKKYFSNVKFISTDLFNYPEFVSKSLEITNSISLKVKGGDIIDKDFSSFFKKMGMDFVFTWDMSSSKHFLTQKMLLNSPDISVDNFGKIHSSLFIEKNEQYESLFNMDNKSPLLTSKKGKLLFGTNHIGLKKDNFADCNGDGFSPQFESFVSSLNWLSQRTAFYSLVSDYLYADIFIHPLRQNFLNNIMPKVYHSGGFGPLNNVLNSLNNKAEKSINNILSSSEINLSFPTPLFLTYLVNKTKDVSKIINYALELRNSKDFFDARVKLRELNSILIKEDRTKYVKEVNRLSIEIDKSFKKIETNYYVDNNQGIPLSNITFFFNIATGTKIKLPKLLDSNIPQLEFLKHLMPFKGFKGVYKNLTKDLVAIERLGKFKDILLANVKYHENVSSWGIKTEDVKYRNHETNWKKPMK